MNPTPEMVEMAEGIARHVADEVQREIVGPLRDENLRLREALQQVVDLNITGASDIAAIALEGKDGPA